MNNLFIDGLDLVSEYVRTINPVTYTDVNGNTVEDYNPFFPFETTTVLAIQEQIKDSGKNVNQTMLWMTGADVKFGQHVQYLGSTYEITGESDYIGLGYSNIRTYELVQLQTTPDTPPTNETGGDEWH